jgi:Ulp1 family protease
MNMNMSNMKWSHLLSAVRIFHPFHFRPCILIFDSLAGVSRSHVVATLWDYLRIEYTVKEGKDREFNEDTIKGSTPRVPQQTNFTDCGVYVLQYVESFFQVMLSDSVFIVFLVYIEI